MFDTQHAKRPENDRSSAEPTREPSRTKQHTGDLTRIPLYTQLAWGNQPPPWLRLPIQRKEPHEEEVLQEENEATQHKENTTGLPDTLKAGIETLSGLSMDDVQVHYHSSQPAEVQALAYTQGTEIHVGPGQEKHLPHEAWHVVQQKQGRVQPTVQMKGRTINDDQGLEREADVMGGEALQNKEIQGSRRTSHDTEAPVNTGEVIQRAVITEDIEGSDEPGTLTYTDTEVDLQLGDPNVGKKVTGIILVLVQVPKAGRGKGIGGNLVEKFLEIVGGKQCYLEVAPLADEERTPEELAEWYARHGFVDTGLKGLTGETIMTNKIENMRIEDMKLSGLDLLKTYGEGSSEDEEENQSSSEEENPTRGEGPVKKSKLEK